MPPVWCAWPRCLGETRAHAAATTSISSSQLSSKDPQITTDMAGRSSPGSGLPRFAIWHRVAPVGQEYSHLDDIALRHAGGRQLRINIRPGLPRLGREVSRHDVMSIGKGESAR